MSELILLLLLLLLLLLSSSSSSFVVKDIRINRFLEKFNTRYDNFDSGIKL